jgi:hypothetical protein
MVEVFCSAKRAHAEKFKERFGASGLIQGKDANSFEAPTNSPFHNLTILILEERSFLISIGLCDFA